MLQFELVKLPGHRGRGVRRLKPVVVSPRWLSRERETAIFMGWFRCRVTTLSL